MIAIYGAGGHGKVVADIAKSLGEEEIFFIDDGLEGVPSFEEFVHQRTAKIPIVPAVGDNGLRRAIAARIEQAHYPLATLIHPFASVASDVEIGRGCVVMAGAVINAGAKIGEGAIVNSGAIVEHDCRIGPFVHLSPGAVLGGGVEVGAQAHLGIGCCVLPALRIGEEAVVGGGAAVIEDVDRGTRVVGVPARVLGEDRG